MWVYLEPWMVQDGALPELARGSYLRGVGLWADYEWDAFELPDLRADWYVRRLKIEQRQIDYVRSGPGGSVAGWPGKVLRSFEIERMSRWDDDHAGAIMAMYVLDLIPLPASQDPAGLQPTIK